MWVLEGGGGGGGVVISDGSGDGACLISSLEMR
jgi:hypothetical protein